MLAILHAIKQFYSLKERGAQIYNENYFDIIFVLQQELVINIHACLLYPSCNLDTFTLQLYFIETSFKLVSCQFASKYSKYVTL